MIPPLHTPGRPWGKPRVRVIPTLLIDGQGRLVKTVKFGKRTYLGDPINAVRIFNDKQADELVLLDIDASREGRGPNHDLISDVAYGGGITTEAQIARLFQAGVDKVVLSSALRGGTGLITAAARRFGAQAVTVCLPVARGLFGGQTVRLCQGRNRLPGTPEDIARQATDAGAGEILVYAIDRDGTYAGYDLALLRRIARAVRVPVVACGGARGLTDMVAAIRDGGCSAVAAGSLFVYQSGRRGVLINYPPPEHLDAALAAADATGRAE
jgi:cyclase